MRTIGAKRFSSIGRLPTAEALQRAAAHLEAGRKLAAVNTTGIAKGLYRFRTLDEASRHAEEALARAIASNARARKRK